MIFPFFKVTLTDLFTFEHMIGPLKWFLWMKVAEPISNVEKSERQREQDACHGINTGCTVGRALTSGFKLTRASIFL